MGGSEGEGEREGGVLGVEKDGQDANSWLACTD